MSEFADVVDAARSRGPVQLPKRQGMCAHVLDQRAVCSLCGVAFGLDPAGLEDAVAVAAQGREIEEAGIPWVVDRLVPGYGMLGMLVAYAKVGKTTFAQALGAAVANGVEFVGRATRRARVLVVAAEDPPEYTAFVARHLTPAPGWMTFWRRPVLLNDDGLGRIVATAKAGGFGLVLVASWQAVVRGLIRDENDNAGAVIVVERTKEATRATGIPWLIDAHAGRNEDQHDDADPTRALRGASAAAGAADYMLWLRFADGAFGSHRRLSGRGRFVRVAPQTIAFDPATGSFEDLGATRRAASESVWRQILERGAVVAAPRSVDAIARAAGLVPDGGKVGGQTRQRVREALDSREGITRAEGAYRGRRTVTYRLDAPNMGTGA